MGWIQKPSAYQYNQQINARRKAQARNFLDQQSILSSAIFGARDNFAYGMTEITLKALAAKLQGQAKAKIDAGLTQIDEKRAELASTRSASPLPDHTK